MKATLHCAFIPQHLFRGWSCGSWAWCEPDKTVIEKKHWASHELLCETPAVSRGSASYYNDIICDVTDVWSDCDKVFSSYCLIRFILLNFFAPFRCHFLELRYGVNFISTSMSGWRRRQTVPKVKWLSWWWQFFVKMKRVFCNYDVEFFLYNVNAMLVRRYCHCITEYHVKESIESIKCSKTFLVTL